MGKIKRIKVPEIEKPKVKSKRSMMVGFTVTTEENAEIVRRAVKMNMKKGDYCRKMALGDFEAEAVTIE